MIGKHAMFAVKDVTLPTEHIARLPHVRDLTHAIAERCQLTVVNESGHQFKPFGVTYVLVLAESHLSIHTYPENQTVYIDIFCCNPSFDERHARSVIEHLFGTDNIDMTSLIR